MTRHQKIIKTSESRSFAEITAEKLRNGGIIAFPTETVFGIGCDIANIEAAEKIFSMKKRPRTLPLSAHVSSVEQAINLIAEKTSDFMALVSAFWPGPLTIVMPKNDKTASEIVCGLDTIGLRMPANKTILQIAQALGRPLAATSANISGSLPINNPEKIADFFPEIDLVIEGDKPEYGIASTVVSLAGKPRIIREGSIKKGIISKILKKDIEEM